MANASPGSESRDRVLFEKTNEDSLIQFRGMSAGSFNDALKVFHDRPSALACVSPLGSTNELNI
ncbi:hypothetical protein ABID97_005268 [Variovorax sp. OAS795]